MNKKNFFKLLGVITAILIVPSAGTCEKASSENALTEEEQKQLKDAFKEGGILNQKTLTAISNTITVVNVLVQRGLIVQQQDGSLSVNPSVVQASTITADGINLANSLAEKIKGQDFSTGKTPKISATQGTCVVTAITPV